MKVGQAASLTSLNKDDLEFVLAQTPSLDNDLNGFFILLKNHACLVYLLVLTNFVPSFDLIETEFGPAIMGQSDLI